MSLNSMQRWVQEFHGTYGAPIGMEPNLIPGERAALRCDLIDEEFTELQKGIDTADLVEIADALGDLLYVVFGTAVEYGIDMQLIVEEIHRSNMSKLGSDGLPIYREDGKVLKGPDYFKPNIAAVLASQPVISQDPYEEDEIADPSDIRVGDVVENVAVEGLDWRAVVAVSYTMLVLNLPGTNPEDSETWVWMPKNRFEVRRRGA